MIFCLWYSIEWHSYSWQNKVVCIFYLPHVSTSHMTFCWLSGLLSLSKQCICLFAGQQIGQRPTTFCQVSKEKKKKKKRSQEIKGKKKLKACAWNHGYILQESRGSGEVYKCPGRSQSILLPREDNGRDYAGNWKTSGFYFSELFHCGSSHLKSLNFVFRSGNFQSNGLCASCADSAIQNRTGRLLQ